MKKRPLAAIAAACLAVGLAACSSAKPTTSPDQAGADGALTGELLFWENAGLVKLADDGTTAEVEKSFLHQAAKLFEAENPETKITIFAQTGDISTSAAQFQAAVQAGNGPDIRSQYAGGPTLSYADFYADLSQYLEQETIDNMAGWVTVREGYEPDGRIVAMPYGAGLYFVVYANNKVLREAGLDPADPPKTWQELIANGQLVADKTDYTPFWVADLEGYVGAWLVGGHIGGELGEASSAGMYDGEIRLDDPAILKAYQAWADFGASGLTNPDAGTQSYQEGGAGFIAGDVAYWVVGTWQNATVLEGLGEEASWFFLPMLEGAQFPDAIGGGPTIAISLVEDSDNKELAVAFLKFLARPEIQDLYVEMLQMEPSNHQAADPSVITNRLLQEQAEQLPDKGPVVFPFDSVMPQSVIDVFYRVNAGVFLGSISPQEAVAQLQTAMDTELADR